MTEKQKMICGKLYNAADNELVKARLRARTLADKYNKTLAVSSKKRAKIIAELLPGCKSGTFLETNIRVEYGFNITAGVNFYMNFDCQLLDVSPITIGDNVMFGPRVTLATPCHPLIAEQRILKEQFGGVYSLEYSKPINIGNNVWIASGVTICGGVTIGDNTVIAAGSVVQKNIPSNVLAAGVPCKVIRELGEKDLMNMDEWKSLN